MAQRETGLTLTVKKAMDILDCLGETGVPLSASEISRKLGMSRSTVYRLLTTLATGGYVGQDPANPEKYRLGFKIPELASSLLGSIQLRQQALPFLQELKDIANETVHLVVMDRGKVTYIDKVECSQAVRMHSAIGRRGFAHCTAVGKAMLAFMSKTEVENVIKEHGLPVCTPNTITEKETLLEELERVRLQGYAVDDIENEEGIRCVGAPIFDHQGRPVAALSMSGPAFRLSMERVKELTGAVISTASKISRQ
ncbi:MAG: IclR family transcriptional regulator, partial [Anaerolineales bacterium]|nr:IclR family transcriptional regulator [Anaerolineales bacterium]